MIYEEMPKDFDSVFEVVSCIVECDRKMLLLHRQDHKPQGGTWGEPAGKMDEGEDIYGALFREVNEETGLKLTDVTYHKKYFVRFPDYDFVFHSFHKVLDGLEHIVINDNEHKDFRWVDPKEALKMPLMTDEDMRIKLFYGIDE